MRGHFNPAGLSIQMQEEDANKSELECIITAFNNPKLIVTVEEDFANNNRRIGKFEEPGFHIESIPHNTGFDICREIHIFLDKKRWHQIFYEYDEEFQGGFFMSRSAYDRVDITYFNPRIHSPLYRKG